MKIVINVCHGGFGLSYGAMLRYCELKGLEVWPDDDGRWSDSWTYWLVPEDQRVGRDDDFYEWPLEERQAYNRKYREQTIDHYRIERNDPILVQVVEEMGQEAAGRFAELKVVDVPDDVEWTLEEYDGWESVHEKHRVWG